LRVVETIAGRRAGLLAAMHLVVLAVVVAAGLAAPVAAQSVAPVLPESGALRLPKSKSLTVSVAGAFVMAPLFSGSRTMSLAVVPDVRFQYRDDVFASMPDGLGWNAINRDGWKLGPLMKWRFGRSQDGKGSVFSVGAKTDALLGMGDVSAAQELGGFAQYGWRKVRARAEVRKGFGGHDGVVADLVVDYSGQAGRAYFGTGVRATFGDERFTNVYYGVDAAQAAATGLPAYHAGSGLVSAGVTGFVLMPMSKRSGITLFGGYDVLGNVAADSSLIRERGQRGQLYLGLAYGMRFGFF
jgi:outer membrane protein